MSYLVLLKFNFIQNAYNFVNNPNYVPLSPEAVSVPSGYTPPAQGIGSPGSSPVNAPNWVIISVTSMGQVPQGYTPMWVFDTTTKTTTFSDPSINPADLTIKGGPTGDQYIINHGVPNTNAIDDLTPPPPTNLPFEFDPLYPQPLSQQPLIEVMPPGEIPEINYNPYLLTPQPLIDVPPPDYVPLNIPPPGITDPRVIPVSDYPMDPNVLRDPNLNPDLTPPPPNSDQKQNYYDLPQPPQPPGPPDLFDPNLTDLFFIPRDINPESWNFQYDNRTDIPGPQEGRYYYTPETPGELPGLIIPTPRSFDPGMDTAKHRRSLRQPISDDGGGGSGGGGGISIHAAVGRGTVGGGNTNYIVSRFTSDGTVNWTVTYTTTSDFVPVGCPVDSSGNVIVPFLSATASFTSLVKFGALNGAVIATYNFNSILPANTSGGTGIDHFDNVYTAFPGTLFTVDKNGNLTQNIALAGNSIPLLATLSDGTTAVTVNQANNFIIYGQPSSPINLNVSGIQCLGGGSSRFMTGSTDFFTLGTFSNVMAMNEPGSTAWSTPVPIGSGNSHFAVSADGNSSNNLFAAVEDRIAAGTFFSLQRYNSSGALIWTVPNFPNVQLAVVGSASGCIAYTAGGTYSGYALGTGSLQWTNTFTSLLVIGRQSW